MAIFGTCKKCGSVTKDYSCFGCVNRELEKAISDNARLTGQLAAIVAKLPNPSTIKELHGDSYQNGLIDAARIVRDCMASNI